MHHRSVSFIVTRQRYRKDPNVACEGIRKAAVLRSPTMRELSCTARRIGDHESRTEEYELTFAVGDAPPETLRIKYQAARAYEINAALDRCAEAARAAIAEVAPDLAEKPTDESLFQFSWKTIQSVKYGEGESRTTTLGL